MRALTASAVRVGGNSKDADYGQRYASAWQMRALHYLDLVPELSYASRFYARMLRQLRIYPAVRDEHGNSKPITSGPPVEALNRIQDPAGGRSGIQGSYGRWMFTTGEGYLFGRNLQSDEERWLFVWTEELHITDVQIILNPLFDKSAHEFT